MRIVLNSWSTDQLARGARVGALVVEAGGLLFTRRCLFGLGGTGVSVKVGCSFYRITFFEVLCNRMFVLHEVKIELNRTKLKCNSI